MQRYNSKVLRCRCDICRAANTAYHKAWRERQKQIAKNVLAKHGIYTEGL